MHLSDVPTEGGGVEAGCTCRLPSTVMTSRDAEEGMAPMSDSHRLTEFVGRGNPDVLGVMVVDGDGTVHASETTSPEMLRAAVICSFAAIDLVERMTGAPRPIG